jgi:hypothetical protein
MVTKGKLTNAQSPGTLPSNGNFDIYNHDFSFSLWFRADAGTYTTSAILSYGQYLDGYQLRWVPDAGWNELRFFVDDGDSTLELADLDVSGGVWHHVAVSIDEDGDAVLFVDGVESDRKSAGDLGNVTAIASKR